MNDKRLIIIGASGHGKVVADAAEKTKKYDEILFLDDADLKWCAEYPVIGVSIRMQNCIMEMREFIVAIGNSNLREKIQDKLLSEDAHLATIIHPSAVIGKMLKLEWGQYFWREVL